MSNILVLSRGAVGRNMGSTGIRSYHMARVLAEQLTEDQVTLAVPNQPDIPSPHPRLRVVRCHSLWAALREMLRHDIIICRNFPPPAMALFLHKRLALDFYVAFFIEWLALSERIPDAAQRKFWVAAKRHYVNFQLTLADYVLCSNERQRDICVGALSTLGLVTPRMYDADNTLRGLAAVVPYGVQPGRPRHDRKVLKGVVPGIRETDRVIIWNGSIMEWFDAQTVIRAMAELSRVRDDVKLFFLGIEHPDWVTGMLFDPPRQAIDLSKRLGLYERSVFFNLDWVPYEEIGNYLAEADIGVCAGFNNLEARYSYRTRFVDLFWAELPIVCTQGDVLAELVERDSLGLVVSPGDAEGLAAAILRLVEDGELYQRCNRNMSAVKEELSWERVLAPLVEFCRSGRSIAAPKRRRLLPLIRRGVAHGGLVSAHVARYLLTRGSRRGNRASS